MPSTKALYLILSVIKTNPVAFHPSKLKGERTGNTATVLFPSAWTGNLPSAALFVHDWRGMLLFFAQHVNLQVSTNYIIPAVMPTAWGGRRPLNITSPAHGRRDAFAKHFSPKQDLCQPRQGPCLAMRGSHLLDEVFKTAKGLCSFSQTEMVKMCAWCPFYLEASMTHCDQFSPLLLLGDLAKSHYHAKKKFAVFQTDWTLFCLSSM